MSTFMKYAFLLLSILSHCDELFTIKRTSYSGLVHTPRWAVFVPEHEVDECMEQLATLCRNVTLKFVKYHNSNGKRNGVSVLLLAASCQSL